MAASNWNSIFALFAVALVLIGPGTENARADEALIVVVRAKSAGPYDLVLTGFRSSLESQGVRGRFDIYTVGNELDEVDRVLDDAVANGADLIFTIGSNVTDRVIQKNPNIPVIYSLVMDAVGTNRIDCTGVVLEFSTSAHFEWMKRFLPKCRRIGVLYNPEANGNRITRAKQLAERKGLILETEAVERPQDIPAALDRIAKKVDVLWGIPDEVVLNPQTAKQLLLFCYRNKIPFIGPSKAWVKAGALYALDRDYADIGSQCAEMAAELLLGKGTGNMRSQAPKKIIYFVNMNTVRHMKLNINKQLLAKADGVY